MSTGADLTEELTECQLEVSVSDNENEDNDVLEGNTPITKVVGPTVGYRITPNSGEWPYGVPRRKDYWLKESGKEW